MWTRPDSARQHTLKRFAWHEHAHQQCHQGNARTGNLNHSHRDCCWISSPAQVREKASHESYHHACLFLTMHHGFRVDCLSTITAAWRGVVVSKHVQSALHNVNITLPFRVPRLSGCCHAMASFCLWTVWPSLSSRLCSPMLLAPTARTILRASSPLATARLTRQSWLEGEPELDGGRSRGFANGLDGLEIEPPLPFLARQQLQQRHGELPDRLVAQRC